MGYKVETYRTKRENGTIVSKELISKDQYSPVPTMIAANRSDIQPEESDSPAAKSAAIVEDGVKVQFLPVIYSDYFETIIIVE